MNEGIQLNFDGLDNNTLYEFDFDGKHYEKSGAYLKNAGIMFDAKQQFFSRIIEIKAK